MTREQEDLVARVLERLASGRDLTPEEIEHLRALDIAAAPEIAAPAPDHSSAVASAVRSRLQIARRTALVLTVVLTAALAVFWWVMGSFYVGHFGHVKPRAAALERMLPMTATFTVLFAMGAGVAVGRLLRRARMTRRIGALVFVVAFAVAAGAYPLARAATATNVNLYAAALAAFMLAGFVMGLMVGRDALPFKRVAAFVQFSGVCAGIAAEWGFNAWWLRALFIVGWLQVPKLAVVAYLLLAASMQVHPEDRASMWRFRIARWFRGTPAAAAN